MFFDIWYWNREFWRDYYCWWFIIGFITGLIDLKHFYNKGQVITLKYVLDLLFFSAIGFIGTFLFIYLHGKEIVLIKHKNK